MAKKTPRAYTLDELKEKSQKALADPKLVEIVKSAPLNKDGRVNCTLAYKEAEKYVYEQTKDLQKTKELAVATRFLAMLCRDFAEEFKKLVSKKTEQSNSAKKSIKDCSLELRGVILTTEETIRSSLQYSKKSMGFEDVHYFTNFLKNLLTLCREVNLMNCEDDIMNDLIQLLEEKFGLKVKVCGNCKYLTLESRLYYTPMSALPPYIAESIIVKAQCEINAELKTEFHTCEKWVMKEKKN